MGYLPAFGLATMGVALCVAMPMAGMLDGDLAASPTNAVSEVIRASCDAGNPYYATSRFGFRLGDMPVLLAFQDTASDAPESLPPPPGFFESAFLPLARERQVGAVYGLAYDWRREHLYASAFANGISPLGSGGPGAIYRIDIGNGHVDLWAVVYTPPIIKLTDMEVVGRRALGDIELDEARSALFATSLYDRRIHRFKVPSGAYMGSFPHGATDSAWSMNARPFGLGYHEGWLYHAVVDSREDSSLLGELSVHVFRSRDDGSEMSSVASASLDYREEIAWERWNDEFPGIGVVTSQPMAADVEFTANGDLVIGLRDRLSTSGLATRNGDVLPTSRTGPSSWSIVTSPEHYFDEFIFDESLQGALAAVPGVDALVATSVLMGSYVGGAAWLDNATGAVGGGPVDGTEHLFGEALYAGDVEALCGPPRPVFLPLVASKWCVRQGPVDVVLVLDMSTSMQRLTRDSRPKHRAATSAAAELVRQLRDEGGEDPNGAASRIAVIGFNEDSWLEQGFADADLAEEALLRLSGRMREGTRIDLALARAFELVSTREAEMSDAAFVVLLTDGHPNRVPAANDGSPETTILQIARALHQEALVYVVGIGTPDDVNEPLLKEVASYPDMFYSAPDAEDLEDIYLRIADAIECP